MDRSNVTLAINYAPRHKTYVEVSTHILKYILDRGKSAVQLCSISGESKLLVFNREEAMWD
jgi:hypothetical protein